MNSVKVQLLSGLNILKKIFCYIVHTYMWYIVKNVFKCLDVPTIN